MRIPAPGDDTKRNQLAAALARIPWELARAPEDPLRLLDRNLVVRVAFGRTADAILNEPVEIGAEEPLKVLLVFAEAPGSSRLLAARLERERLLALFFDEILPHRRVEVDVLCHGVTRARLATQIKNRGGYHVVHWSGHGTQDGLLVEPDEPGGPSVSLRGKELADIFGESGFFPSLFFLGACHGGHIREASEWAALQARARHPEMGEEVRSGELAPLPKIVEETRGHVGTALGLLEAGVEQVVAMRYEVRDVYARRLARRFFRHVLADEALHPADVALSLARKELVDDAQRAGQYHPADHADPVILGARRVQLRPASGASAQMERRDPRPPPLLPRPIRDLDPPHGFLGRSVELGRLGREWIDGTTQPMALLTGLAGMGKTTLAAEAIHLWHDRFRVVLAFQSRAVPLRLDELYRQVHTKLLLELPHYRETVRKNPTRAIHFEKPGDLSSDTWLDALQQNLLDVMRRESILLVLDNFETHLGSERAERGYSCLDPRWDALLGVLVDDLAGRASRVLVTSRHVLQAYRPGKVCWVQIGALSKWETALFVQGRPHLQAMVDAGGETKELLDKMLTRSGGHPFVLAQLDALVRQHVRPGRGLSEKGRATIEQVVDGLEVQGFSEAPGFFESVVTGAEREAAQAYWEEVAFKAADRLIERLSVPARRLCYVVTRAEEAVPEEMIEAVWREWVPAEGTTLEELLEELSTSGLVQRGDGMLGFHPLVGERTAAWRAARAKEADGSEQAGILRAFGGWYASRFWTRMQGGKMVEALEAGRRGIRELVRAGAIEGLARVAPGMVTSTRDPAQLSPIIADLRAVIDLTPPGRARWVLRSALADALDNVGRPNDGLTVFQQAATEAEEAGHHEDLSIILQDWACALVGVGEFEEARRTYQRSARVAAQAGRHRVYVLGSELEALRIDVIQGRAADVLSAIEARLGEVHAFWQRRQTGEEVPNAPGVEQLARVLISALDIAREALSNLEQWQEALDRIDAIEAVDRARGESMHTLARTRFNRYQPLLELARQASTRGNATEERRLCEVAKRLLEECLDIFRGAGDVIHEVTARSALANVWSRLGDPAQALKQEQMALDVRNAQPAPEARSVSHHNLAAYLQATGKGMEGSRHWLAGLVYRLATGLDVHPSLRALAFHHHLTSSRGETFTPPTLASLLQDPEFAPLRQFLADRGEDIEALDDRIRAAIETASGAENE
ncbi:CHAT domain-containing protein [Polyangium sp. 15x6]|uniref:CHAT domain-containing protein n=1 Tax=Polyangium sp. 15x6 TaxID=3042687 RepID=UPI00249C875C|nr:CHAT domain-containing protein [Polyangium sp. 15x6]MDI3283852.1 CHAT domain-containing protein [Polyangium sp. 15x6]